MKAESTWNTWSSWEECSMSCDGGTQNRTRTCNYDDGSPCMEMEAESELCNTQICGKY